MQNKKASWNIKILIKILIGIMILIILFLVGTKLYNSFFPNKQDIETIEDSLFVYINSMKKDLDKYNFNEIQEKIPFKLSGSYNIMVSENDPRILCLGETNKKISSCTKPLKGIGFQKALLFNLDEGINILEITLKKVNKNYIVKIS